MQRRRGPGPERVEENDLWLPFWKHMSTEQLRERRGMFDGWMAHWRQGLSDDAEGREMEQALEEQVEAMRNSINNRLAELERDGSRRRQQTRPGRPPKRARSSPADDLPPPKKTKVPTGSKTAPVDITSDGDSGDDGEDTDKQPPPAVKTTKTARAPISKRVPNATGPRSVPAPHPLARPVRRGMPSNGRQPRVSVEESSSDESSDESDDLDDTEAIEPYNMKALRAPAPPRAPMPQSSTGRRPPHGTVKKRRFIYSDQETTDEELSDEDTDDEDMNDVTGEDSEDSEAAPPQRSFIPGTVRKKPSATRAVPNVAHKPIRGPIRRK
ncbi:hypothetical protein JX266_008446 [Neoarthrinium moseri]|nr:hypothetical protein JX266_008446 [Neoarthrinium moseri]